MNDIDDPRPKPVYATARNTPSVRKGYEMSGYLKNRDEIDAWKERHGAPKAQEGTKSGAGDDFEDETYIGLPVRAGASQSLKEIGFHVPGAVTGKMRARIGRMGAYTRMFTPEKTVVYENLVKFHAARAMQTDPPIAGPVQVNMLIGVAVPASWSKKKQAAALAGELFPTSKPDLDNSIKSVFDAMNGVVYKDDAQVVTTVCKKRFREAPGLWVTVFAMDGETT